jgi:hypothetical protein
MYTFRSLNKLYIVTYHTATGCILKKEIATNSMFVAITTATDISAVFIKNEINPLN